MKKIALIISLITLRLVVSTPCFTQNKVLIRYEVGIEKSIYKIQNPQKNSVSSGERGGYVGFSFSHSLTKKIHLETGIYSKTYFVRLFSNIPDSSTFDMLLYRNLIPFRIQFKKGCLNDKVMLNFTVGTSISTQNSVDGFYHKYNGEWKEIQGSVQSKNIKLYELGIGADFLIGKHFNMGIQVHKSFGLKYNQINHYTGIVRSNNLTTDYRITSNGDFNALTASIGYAFNYNFRKNEKK
jgi:hypothetical protein